MTKGIAITITRMQEVRRFGPDEAGFHSVWNGERWISLAVIIWSPWMAKRHKEVPMPITTRLEFASVRTTKAKAIERKRALLRELVKQHQKLLITM